MNEIINAIKIATEKDYKAYRVTELYLALSGGKLDDTQSASYKGELLDIEKYLINWTKEHPTANSSIMPPEERALLLIKDLREKKAF